jgi:hypothetical protein
MTLRDRGVGPPGPEDDDARPKPGHAEKVVTNHPITITASRSPNGRGIADCMAADRREGDKTPRGD